MPSTPALRKDAILALLLLLYRPRLTPVAMNAGDLGADLEGATTFTVIFKQVGMQVPAY